MNPEVSICMCSYRRAPLLRRTLESIAEQRFPSLEVVVCEDGDDGGATRAVCEEFGARYFQRKNRPDQPYSNPAAPFNIAIRRARGEILILQNPECRHAAPDVIERLAAPHRSESHLAVFAAVMALDVVGNQLLWYCHPRYSARPFFFCGSVRREHVWRIRGFDEDFTGYGYDDDFFALCLNSVGVRFVFRDDVPVEHQWHEGTNCFGLKTNHAMFQKKLQEFSVRGPESNAGREWGSLEPANMTMVKVGEIQR